MSLTVPPWEFTHKINPSTNEETEICQGFLDFLEARINECRDRALQQEKRQVKDLKGFEEEIEEEIIEEINSSENEEELRQKLKRLSALLLPKIEKVLREVLLDSTLVEELPLDVKEIIADMKAHPISPHPGIQSLKSRLFI